MHTLICSTGWKHKLCIRSYLGIPYYDPSTDDFGDDPLVRKPFVKKADEVIFTRFPWLRDQANFISPCSPWRPRAKHGRRTAFIRICRTASTTSSLPPTHAFRNSIVFLGASKCIALITNMHIHAPWAVVYLDGRIPGLSPSPASPSPPSNGQEELLWDATLTSRFGRRRYPTGMGRSFPNFVSGAVQYWDLLLGDLGLQRKRKGGGLRAVYDSYGPSDFRTTQQRGHQSRVGCGLATNISKEK
jgi:hypothetical protein